MTYGELYDEFKRQFPGLKIRDYRPHGENTIFIWVDESPYNIIASCAEKNGAFALITTKQEEPEGRKNDRIDRWALILAIALVYMFDDIDGESDKPHPRG